MLKNEIKEVIGAAGKRELRKFGVTIGVFLGLLAVFLFWKGRPSAEYFGYVAAAFWVLGLLVPMLLKPIYIAWMSFAVVMGFVMTRVILTLLYAIVFTPVGLVLRLLRKDPLHERLDPQADSYWISRQKEPFDPKSVENQF